MLCAADYLSLPGKACHQMLRSLPLPSSSNVWAMGFNLIGKCLLQHTNNNVISVR